MTFTRPALSSKTCPQQPSSMQVVTNNKTGTPEASTRLVAQTLRAMLRQYDGEILLVGHSQGAAVSAAAIKYLPTEDERRVNFISIGGASCDVPFYTNSVTAYINSRDIVPERVGLGQASGRARLELHRLAGTSVHVKYYSFGIPAHPGSTHGIDDYFGAAKANTPSFSPGASEVRAAFRAGVRSVRDGRELAENFARRAADFVGSMVSAPFPKPPSGGKR